MLSERLHTGVLVANAIALVAGTTAALGLVPLVGAKGAAAATVVGESILTLAYAVALFRRGGDLRISPRVVPKVLVNADGSLDPGEADLAAVIDRLAPPPQE